MNGKSGAQKYMEAEKAIIQKNFKILELKDEIVKLRAENEQLKGTIKKALIENAGLNKKIEMWKDEKVTLAEEEWIEWNFGLIDDNPMGEAEL